MVDGGVWLQVCGQRRGGQEFHAIKKEKTKNNTTKYKDKIECIEILKLRKSTFSAQKNKICHT